MFFLAEKFPNERCKIPVTEPGSSRPREQRQRVENRNDSGNFGFAAVKLVLELIEHDAKAEGDSVSDHVDKEGGGNDDPSEATVRGTRQAGVGGGGRRRDAGARHC